MHFFRYIFGRFVATSFELRLLSLRDRAFREFYICVLCGMRRQTFVWNMLLFRICVGCFSLLFFLELNRSSFRYCRDWKCAQNTLHCIAYVHLNQVLARNVCAVRCFICWGYRHSLLIFFFFISVHSVLFCYANFLTQISATFYFLVWP